MSKFKLTYFDMDGGRGEPIRMAAAIGGIDFEDNRISFQEFGETRDKFPLTAVPTMEIDGVEHIQSNAMCRYIGKQAGLYPDDPRQAFLCDEVLETVDDASIAMVRTFGLEGDEMKTAREALIAGPFTRILNLLGTRLDAADGEFFADDRLTVADLKVFVWLRSLHSGILDHVPTDLVQKVAPQLVGHMKLVAAHPDVAAYLDGLDA